MGSTWLALHADLRMRWRAMAGLALLLGLIGGVVLTAAAGARRTDTAYPRLLRSPPSPAWTARSVSRPTGSRCSPAGSSTRAARMPP